MGTVTEVEVGPWNVPANRRRRLRQTKALKRSRRLVQPVVQGAATQDTERSMSTVDAGQATEQQSEPTFEAGCKDEVSRNVQGTALSAGFAELRARCRRYYRNYVDMNYTETCNAIDRIMRDIDAIEADAKDETR